jgi:hypothetical protein
LRRSHESRGQCSTDAMGCSNVSAEPAKSVNISATSLSAHADKLRTVRQWLHKLQSVLVMLHIAILVVIKTIMFCIINAVIISPVTKAIHKMPDCKLKRLLLVKVY